MSTEHKHLSREDIEKALSPLFAKNLLPGSQVEVTDVDDTHIRITTKSMMLVVSREAWRKAMEEAAKTK